MKETHTFVRLPREDFIEQLMIQRVIHQIFYIKRLELREVIEEASKSFLPIIQTRLNPGSR